MQLPVVFSLILILAGLWNLVVWPAFFMRVMKDPRAKDEAGALTKFFWMHAMLISTSLILGVAILVIGIRTFGSA